KSVATLGEGLDEAGNFGGVPERFAKLVNGFVEAVIKIDEGVSGPEFCAQFFASDDLAGTFEQRGEKSERLILETDALAVVAQFSCLQIQLKRSELNALRTSNRMFHRGPWYPLAVRGSLPLVDLYLNCSD